MDDFGQVLSLCQKIAQRLAILGVEKLVRKDEAEAAFRIQERESLLDEDHVDVVVPLPGRGKGGLVEFHLQGRPLLHRLDADVGRVPDDGVEAALSRSGAIPPRSPVFPGGDDLQPVAAAKTSGNSAAQSKTLIR